ncbi:hypothetical protein FACS189444_0210 [Spirochaetia bacterium]|nr:hypothetical protein FACS189444_0210 [Spirochaetia bacterium]
MKKIMTVVLFSLLGAFFFMGCENETGFGYDTNGNLEGTVWANGGKYLSFSKYAVAVSHDIDLGSSHYYLKAGTYSSYRDGSLILVQLSDQNEVFFELEGVTLNLAREWGGWEVNFYPSAGTLFINGNERYFNDFIAKEINGGLTIKTYIGNQKNLTIPAEIGGIPVVAIGNDDGSSPFAGDYSYLQLISIVIPDSVTTIKPGAFRSSDLFGYNGTAGDYLSGGITIGANVTIMGENAGAGWDQGWGALDPVKIGVGNFIAYEREHLGYWLDIQFTKFYNSNGRKAGIYKWTSSYDSYNYRYTFTWFYNGVALSDPANPVSKLPAPASFTVTVTGYDSIRASWSSVPGAMGYRLYGFNGRADPSITTTSTYWSGYYYDTDGGTWMYMQVCAFDASGEGELSSYPQ